MITGAETILAPAARAARATTDLLRVEPLDASLEHAWDGFVRAHGDGTVFHTIAWRDAVRESFGHRDDYLIAIRGDRVVGALPLVRIESRWFGRRLVSVPYAVGGGIIADDVEAADALFIAARAIAENEHFASVELRSERGVAADVPIVDRYVTFDRALPRRVDEVLEWLPRKARAAARNARQKFRLTVEFGDEHLCAVWSMYCANMRRLGSINYPYRFFERLIAHTTGAHWVAVVRRDGKPVSGLVTFLFRDRVLPYFYGAVDEARRCSAANFTYLSVMERAVERGYRVFDFGRSRKDNPGSFDFKRFHGFEPRPLAYQTWLVPGARAVELSPGDSRFRFARSAWSIMPQWVTRPLGAYLSRHLPG